MFLMIFVNDLWSLTGVPEWLEHAAATEDRMGFSDVIFPLFLFIVGLSIPLAVNVRLRKNDNSLTILGHIVGRTLALLVMGFYMVNFESINDQNMLLNKHLWEILMALAIFLLWMNYKRIPRMQKPVALALKMIGLFILVFLAWIYKGGTVNDPEWMKPHWWGILGLIGWAYLLNSVLYLFLRKRAVLLPAAFILLLFMNVQESGFFESLPKFKLVISASNHVLVMAGMLCTMLFLHFRNHKKSIPQFLALISLAALVFVAYGLMIRPVFPISKIFATPSWSAICIGIGLLSYAALYVIVDKLGYSKWAKPIKPAGTSTLTCYLMPYFIYPIMVLSHFKLPEMVSDGLIGIGKSLLFSLLIILFVGFLEKRNISLKI